MVVGGGSGDEGNPGRVRSLPEIKVWLTWFTCRCLSSQAQATYAGKALMSAHVSNARAVLRARCGRPAAREFTLLLKRQ